MATDVCNQLDKVTGDSQNPTSIPDDHFNLVSLSEHVNPVFRKEAKNCLKAIDVIFDEASEVEKAESWLEWAKRFKYLKLVNTRVPDFILPKNCSGELIDVKVFSKHGPDDPIYDAHKMVRDRVARGNCFLHLTKGKHRGPRCILYALKKFTGGLGDDDDNDKGDNTAWKQYFTKSIDKAKNIISTRKANGEAAHLSCIQIDGQHIICAGSKNVHILIRNKEDIAFYRGDRYRIASEVCHTILDCLEEMELAQKQRLLNFLTMTRLTAVFEILSPLHQHVEDLSAFKKPALHFIAWTSTDLEPMPGNQLCAFPPHIGIEIARALGLTTVEYISLHPSHLVDKMAQIRQGYQYEGEVLYFLDDENCVIGILKKKTVWYIICRALREKVRNVIGTQLKHKSSFSLTKSVKLVEERLNEIQSWLVLSEQAICQWKIVGIAFLKWSIEQLELGHLRMTDIADRFPIIWKRHLAESNLSDHIVVECTDESLESSDYSNHN